MLETQYSTFKANADTESTLFPSAAMAMVLLFVQHVSPIQPLEKGIQSASTEGTALDRFSGTITELDLFEKISEVFDALVQNQVELDIDSKRVLYNNIWELYS